MTYGVPTLSCLDLHVSFGRGPVLNGATLYVAEGEILLLIGRNGSGKSTLFNAITGLLPAQRGAIMLRDRSLVGLPTHIIQSLGVSYVRQGGRVFGSMTARENLGLSGLFARDDGSGGLANRVDALLEDLPQLGPLLHRNAGTLSGGERQLLSLAMGLVQRPRVLLLDEPTAGMSPSLVRESLTAICRLARARGSAVVLIEQNVRQALDWADRVVLLSRGQVLPLSGADEDIIRAAFF